MPCSSRYKLAIIVALLTVSGCVVKETSENAVVEDSRSAINQKTSMSDGQEYRNYLSRQAAAYLAAGKITNAKNVLDEALQLSRQNSDELYLSLIYGQISDMHLLQRQLQPALHYAQKAVDSARQTNRIEAQASSLNYLGNSLFALQNYDKSLKAYGEAKALLANAGSASLRATVLINLCNLHLALNQPAEAGRAVNEAIAFVRDMPTTQEKSINLIATGYIILQLNNFEIGNKPAIIKKAFEVLNEALIISETLNYFPGISYANGHLAELYVITGQYSIAGELLSHALFFAAQSDSPELTARWQWQQARLLQQQGNPEAAKNFYAKALEQLDSIQSSLLYGRRGWANIELDQRIYSDYISLLLQEATVAVDKNQRSMLLHEVRGLLENANSNELTNYFQDECVEEQRKKNSILSLDERIQSGIAVLYTIIFPDRLVLLLNFTGGEIRQFSIPVTDAHLTEVSSQFRRELSRYGNPRKIRQQGQQLYAWLIQPIRTFLNTQEINTLVIVATGILRTIPFAALYDGKQFLINDFAMAVTPGLELTSTGQPFQSLLNNRLLLNGLSEPIAGFSALPFVEEEMNRIEPIYESTLLMNEDFRYRNVENQLQQYIYSSIVFATHSQFNQDVNQSFLLSDDGKINLNELDELIRLNQFHEPPIDLLVLSACETAVGDQRAALGMAGAAVKAGAGSVLASLWLANDASTATLIPTFFENLKNYKLTKAQALQRAQKSMLSSGSYRHPFHWSGFLLIGKWL